MGVEIQNTTKINNKWQEKCKSLLKFKRSLRSQKGATILLRKVLIDLQSYSPFSLDVNSKVTAANITKISQNTQNTQEYSNYSKFKIILRSLGATPMYSDKLHQSD